MPPARLHPPYACQECARKASGRLSGGRGLRQIDSGRELRRAIARPASLFYEIGIATPTVDRDTNREAAAGPGNLIRADPLAVPPGKRGRQTGRSSCTHGAFVMHAKNTPVGNRCHRFRSLTVAARIPHTSAPHPPSFTGYPDNTELRRNCLSRPAWDGVVGDPIAHL